MNLQTFLRITLLGGICLVVTLGLNQRRTVVSPSHEPPEVTAEETASIEGSPRVASPNQPPEATKETVPAKTVPERLPWHEIVERMNWSHEGLERIVHPDGRQTLRASGRFVHLSALVTLANGEHRIVCFSDPQAVKAAFDGEPFTEATPTHGKDGHAAF